MRQLQSNSTHTFFFACATIYAKSWCLFVCHLYMLQGKERAGEYIPSPSWLWQCLRLNASHSLARVQNLFLTTCFTTTPATPTPPVCYIEVGYGTGELANLSADKACVVIGVLGR